MKRTLTLFSALILTLAFQADAQDVLVLQGVYKGKNLYVNNPFAAEGAGFCAFEVRVNGEVSSDEVNSTAFAIDLAQYAFKMGDEITVELKHKKGCTPGFINPLAIAPEATFQIKAIDLQSDGTLTWTTTSESGSLPFRIEQFKWNKWVAVGEVEGKGTSTENRYSFQADLHSGENTFRISQADGKGGRISSGSVKVISNRPGEIELMSDKASDTFSFSGPTSWEIFSVYGELVMKGFGKEVDARELPKGKYYLNFSNKAGVSIQKK